MTPPPESSEASRLTRDIAPAQGRSARRRWWRGVVIFLVAFVVRAGLGTYRMSQAESVEALEFPDEQQYWAMAVSLSAGDGLRDELGFRATRMPLYPCLLAPMTLLPRGILVARFVQWIIGALTAVAAAALAASLHRSARKPNSAGSTNGIEVGTGNGIAWLAGLAVALDPFLAVTSSLLLTETVFTLALVGLWLVLARTMKEADSAKIKWTWVSAGLFSAVCVYLRESALGLVWAVLALMVFVSRNRRPAFMGAFAAAAIVFIALIPWAVRNRVILGEWCFLTTRGGISLYDGVRPGATGASDLGDVKAMPAVRDLTETEWNHYFMAESWRFIRQEPSRMCRLAWDKLKRTWNPIPNVETYRSRALRTLTALWNVPVFILAAVGGILTWKQQRKGAAAILIFLILPTFYVSALHSLFVGSVRYRLVAMPMLEFLAARGLHGLWLSATSGRNRRAR